MNDDDDFVERLRRREIAGADQREAHDETVNDQERVRQTVREGARSAFEEMRSSAEGLVKAANAKLTEKFTSVPAPAGFGIMLGNKTASFTYAPPMFANEGVPLVIVTFQSLASNFGFVQDPFDEADTRIATWEFEPVWDTEANSIVWRKGSSTRSSRDIVRSAMEQLQARSH
jgi:hypothetical protein